MAAATGLIDAAEATRNPLALSFALLRLRPRLPRRRSRPRAGRPAPGPGDRPRQRQPRQRVTPGGQPVPASRPNTATRWPRSTTSRWRSATTTTRATPPVACPSGCPRRLFRPARTPRTSGHHRRFRRQPPSPHVFPEINTAITHLREVLGDQTYESLARKGETMTTAAMATYAYDQIDQARAELNAVSK